MSTPFSVSVSQCAAFALWLVVTCGIATAEPIAIDPEAKPATLIEFKVEPKLGDFVGRAEGTVDSEGRRFYLKGLDVMSPLSIHVFAKDPAKPIDVSLHRFMWRDVNHAGTTDAQGDWSYIGRVHDEVGIELKAADPAEFYVLAWRGPAQQTDFGANLFIPAQPGSGSTASAQSGGSVPWLPITIVVALTVLAIVFMVLKFRSNPTRTVTVACFTAIFGMAATDADADTVSAFGTPSRRGRGRPGVRAIVYR